MSDIISMHRVDLVNAVTKAVQPLKARIDELEKDLAHCEKVRDQWCDEFREQRDDANALVKKCAALQTALRYWMPSNSPSVYDTVAYARWQADRAMAFGVTTHQSKGGE